MATVRDKMWLFGVKAHQDDVHLGQCPRYLRDSNCRSRITPAEGAFMLNVPNMIMIPCDGVPAPYSWDAQGYLRSFSRLDKVHWGIMGSGGCRAGNEEQFVVDMMKKYPNLCGVYMDDFFGIYQPDDEERNEKAIKLLKGIRETLATSGQEVPINMTFYNHELDKMSKEVFDYVDALTLWDMHNTHVPTLPDRFEFLEKEFPKHKKYIGIYIYDFMNNIPYPDDMMEAQCEYALKLLKEGRIEGMIFECNAVMGLGFPSEKWLTDWIEKVKDIEL